MTGQGQGDKYDHALGGRQRLMSSTKRGLELEAVAADLAANGFLSNGKRCWP
jgi:hypothetical protein